MDVGEVFLGKINKNIFGIKEQTRCPYCKNKKDNLIIQRGRTHEHHSCGKCYRNYIIETLAPWEEIWNR